MSNSAATATHAKGHQQYGAVPFTVDAAGRVRVALLTSRETRRWVIPKGWPIANLTGAEVASREAIEEAGLSGAVAVSKPARCYTYAKRLSTGKTINCRVEVYLLHVQAELNAVVLSADRRHARRGTRAGEDPARVGDQLAGRHGREHLMAEWSRNAAGQITLCPLVGYVVNTISEMALCVRLEYIQSKEQLDRKPDAVQLVMTPDAAEALADALSDAIRRTKRRSSRGRGN